MHQVKHNKTQIIKNTPCKVPDPTCFGTKVPSSGNLVTTKDRKRIKYFR